jgi:hypothetical protein
VNYKTPLSADDVRSFLGLVGYYRKFSPNFGSIAKPLTRKTHKDMLKQPFVWTEEDQKAFETLRDRFFTPPVLAYPNFDDKFLLFMDACDYGTGAVLSKIQNGDEHPIVYASRQLRIGLRSGGKIGSWISSDLFSTWRQVVIVFIIYG